MDGTILIFVEVLLSLKVSRNSDTNRYIYYDQMWRKKPNC
jgi:hypothetical protein